MKVRDLLHAEPAELRAADGAGHVVTRPVVHLDYQHVTPRADLQLRPSHHSALPAERLSLGPGHVTGLVGMPLGLAVVTEAEVTSLSLAVYLRAGGTLGGHHSEGAVGCRAPPSVWVCRQHSPQHQRLVEVQQGLVLAHQHLYVIRVEVLAALSVGTAEVDSALLDLNPDVFLETDHTGEMVAAPEVGELLSADLTVTERTFLQPAWLAGGGSLSQGASCSGSLHTGAGAGVVSLHSHHPAGLTLSLNTRLGALSLPLTPTSTLPLPVLGPAKGRRQERVGVEQSSQREPRPRLGGLCGSDAGLALQRIVLAGA